MYYVYLMASGKHGTLYVGFTNDLVRRVYQHKEKITQGFTSRYDVDRLVWYECHDVRPQPSSAKSKSRSGAANGKYASLKKRISIGSISTVRSPESKRLIDSGLRPAAGPGMTQNKTSRHSGARTKFASPESITTAWKYGFGLAA
jgi:predicted GIY-YIG superfamily endonuclease